MEIDLYNWLMVFLRVSAFLLVLPFFSMTNFPATMRVALGADRAAARADAAAVPDGQPGFFLAVRRDDSGSRRRTAARVLWRGMVFYAVDLAGNIIATEMGLNMGAIMDPMSRQVFAGAGDDSVFSGGGGDADAGFAPLGAGGFRADLLGAAHRRRAFERARCLRCCSPQTSDIFMVALQIAAPVHGGVVRRHRRVRAC